MLELVPEGFAEEARGGAVALVAYVTGEREAAIRAAFPTAEADDVEAGWEHRWREFHRPVRVGPLWVGPPWATPDPGALAVVIDPGLAFGTGAHPSTRLCLELLLALSPGSTVDLGCGSGVLAIAAAKLGFVPVRACDCDPLAVAAARENARANGVLVDVELGDVRDAAAADVRVAVANISRDVVAALGPALRARHVITAGYLADDAICLTEYRHEQRRERSGWAADLHVRK